MIVQAIEASRCPRCGRIVVPGARYCPDHPVAMEPAEGFKAPLHIALIELEGGARLFCHGQETRGIKIGSSVGVESLDGVFYFSHMSYADRARLFWRRAGARGEKVASITKSLAKGLFQGRSDDES